MSARCKISRYHIGCLIYSWKFWEGARFDFIYSLVIFSKPWKLLTAQKKRKNVELKRQDVENWISKVIIFKRERIMRGPQRNLRMRGQRIQGKYSILESSRQSYNQTKGIKQERSSVYIKCNWQFKLHMTKNDPLL